MQRFFWVLVAAIGLGTAPTVSAQNGDYGTGSSATGSPSIVAVIESQLDAFQRDDGPGAFAFASPSIRQMFGTPERFLQMVQTGYPQVYRPQSVTFLELIPTRRGPVQRVLFLDQSGVPTVALYVMQQQPDGSWRIDGVLIERGSGVSA